jgi:hypothetical protein
VELGCERLRSCLCHIKIISGLGEGYLKVKSRQFGHFKVMSLSFEGHYRSFKSKFRAMSKSFESNARSSEVHVKVIFTVMSGEVR